MMGKYTRLGKNTLIVFIGGAGSKLVGIFMLPLYTRWLSTSDYGITDMITVYATLLLSIVTCCIYDSIFIFPKGQDFTVQKEYFSSGLVFSLTMLAITAGLFAIFLQAWSISVLEEFGKKDYAVFYNKILRWGVTLLIFLLCIVTFLSQFMVSLFASQACLR